MVTPLLTRTPTPATATIALRLCQFFVVTTATNMFSKAYLE